MRGRRRTDEDRVRFYYSGSGTQYIVFTTDSGSSRRLITEFELSRYRFVEVAMSELSAEERETVRTLSGRRSGPSVFKVSRHTFAVSNPHQTFDSLRVIRGI